MFLNVNALDMPGIFAMNKSIANVGKLLDMHFNINKHGSVLKKYRGGRTRFKRHKNVLN